MKSIDSIHDSFVGKNDFRESMWTAQCSVLFSPTMIFQDISVKSINLLFHENKKLFRKKFRQINVYYTKVLYREMI